MVPVLTRRHLFEHVAMSRCATRDQTALEVVFLREENDVRRLGEDVDEIPEIESVVFLADLTLAEALFDVLETDRQPADVDRRDNSLGCGRAAARAGRLGRLRRCRLGSANQGHSQE